MTECLQFRHRMIPYLYTMSVRATTEGRSLVEPMYYDHPTDAYAYRNKNQYLFGSEMIVCPITTPKVFATNMGKVECWLPPGRYVDIFTGSVYDGDRVIDMHRPTTHIPVLSGAGSIFPLSNETETTNGAPIPASLEVVVTVGVDAEFTLMEDDGTAEDIDHIEFAKTPITYTQSTGRVKIGPTEHPLIAERAWCLNLPAFPTGRDMTVEVDGKKVDAKVEQTETATKIHLGTVKAEHQVIVSLGPDLRLCSNDLFGKVQQVVARAQIEHDTKHEILTHVKADISRSVLVSRIAATEMDCDMRSALMEFIVADEFD